jgi:hypothetical protein
VSVKSQEKTGRKPFYTRLPASTYRKLRKLAKLDDVEPAAEAVGILFRFHADTHEKLKRLTLQRSLVGPEMTMQSMLSDLIDKAHVKDLQTRADMHDVVRQLIQAASVS